MRDQADQFKPLTILIEDKASGTQLIQDLTYQGLHAIQSYQTNIDKVMRLHTVSATFENGFVHLPERASWLDLYVHELISFPRAKYDDQVDSTSQGLDWYKQINYGPSVTFSTVRL